MITTVIPTYNGERYLEETLRSLAEQTCLPVRVIVLDDGSTDSTLKIAAQFYRLQITVRTFPNAGSLTNHNRGLEYAPTTQFLHFLHQDDVLHPQFYEAVLSSYIHTGVTGRSLAFCYPASAVDPTARWNGEYTSLPSSAFIRERAILGPTNPSCVVLKTDYRETPCYFGIRYPQVGDQVFLALYASACDKVIRFTDRLCMYRTNPHGDTAQIVRKHFDSWVCDELPAMREIAWLLPRPPLCKPRFLARSVMKAIQRPKQSPRIAWLTARTLLT